MAQAFEIPKGVTGAHSGALAAGSDVSHRDASSNAFFQIAAPAPTEGPDRYREYGSAAGLLQALTLHGPRPARFPARLSWIG